MVANVLKLSDITKKEDRWQFIGLPLVTSAGFKPTTF